MPDRKVGKNTILSIKTAAAGFYHQEFLICRSDIDVGEEIKGWF
jgi:hypothetical protein